MVLGIQWFEQLGTVACNWRQLTMEFTWGNQSHKLQGIDNRAIGCASMKSVSKAVRHGGTFLQFVFPFQLIHLHSI